MDETNEQSKLYNQSLVRQLVYLGLVPCEIETHGILSEDIDPTKLRILAKPTDDEYYCIIDDKGGIVRTIQKSCVSWVLMRPSVNGRAEVAETMSDEGINELRKAYNVGPIAQLISHIDALTVRLEEAEREVIPRVLDEQDRRLAAEKKLEELVEAHKAMVTAREESGAANEADFAAHWNRDAPEETLDAVAERARKAADKLDRAVAAFQAAALRAAQS